MRLAVGLGVGVRVSVGVGVRVSVGVCVAVAVGVAVDVSVGVAVCVGAGTTTGVSVGTGVTGSHACPGNRFPKIRVPVTRMLLPPSDMAANPRFAHVLAAR